MYTIFLSFDQLIHVIAQGGVEGDVTTQRHITMRIKLCMIVVASSIAAPYSVTIRLWYGCTRNPAGRVGVLVLRF